MLAAGALLFGFADYLGTAAQAIRFPFELDYGEGIVWQQMRMIMSGEGYGAIDGFPAIVFHYPPLFHVLAAALAGATGLDPLAAGRLLSVAATVVSGVLMAAIVARMARAEAGPAASWMCGVVAGLMLFGLLPVVEWSNLMRVDMIALAFSLAGFGLGLRALNRPGSIYPAALCFVAAVYTKQTALAAPVAVFGILLFLRPRTALAGIASCVVLGLSAMTALQWSTGGGFFRHIFLYNLNRFEAGRLLIIVGMEIVHLLYLVVAAFGVAYRLRRRAPAYRGCSGMAELRDRVLSSPGDAAFAMLLAYLLLTTLMLGTVAKSGANINYFIEWMCVCAMLAGLAMRDAAMTALTTGKTSGPVLTTAILPVAIALQAVLLPGGAGQTELVEPARKAELEQIAQMVAAADRPVISDDMVILLRAGKSVVWEPAIFAELASTGLWAERPFVERIERRAFAFFITVRERGDRLFDSRYNPAVADAMDAAYPVKRSLAGLTLHFPRDAQQDMVNRSE